MEEFCEFVERHPTWNIEFSMDNSWIKIKVSGYQFHVEKSIKPCHFRSTLEEIEETFKILS